MNQTIQAQNVFEYKRVSMLSEAIYLGIDNYDFDPEQIIMWCKELSERIKTVAAIEQISETDRMVLEMAAEGSRKVSCIKLYHELTGESLRDSKSHVEAICSEYFDFNKNYQSIKKLLGDVEKNNVQLNLERKILK